MKYTIDPETGKYLISYSTYIMYGMSECGFMRYEMSGAYPHMTEWSWWHWNGKEVYLPR